MLALNVKPSPTRLAPSSRPAATRLAAGVARPRLQQGRRAGLSRVQTRVANVDESNFEQEVLQETEKAVLVDFWDTWCGPCKLMDPLMQWAEQEYGSTLKVVKIRHDSCPKLIERYKVYGLPAFLVFKNGELVPGCKKEGAVNQKMLTDYLKQHGAV